MKRPHVLAIALLCLLLGAAMSHLFTSHAEAQSVQVGRYQLFQGRYMVNSSGGGSEVNGVFRIDTVTGKTDGYFAGTNRDGKYLEGWTPIP